MPVDRVDNLSEITHLRDEAYNICREYLSGTWKKIKSRDMVFKSISGGLSNVLFYCSLPSTHTPLVGEPSQVLLRMYGQLHSGDGDSEAKMTESVIFMLLSERNLGPKLYGIFPGGRLEEYLHARAMICTELRDPILSGIIARKLARVHSLNVPIHKEPSWLFDSMYQWLNAIRAKTDELALEGESKAIAEQLLSFDFESEINWLKTYLKKCHSPVVFCHNDLQEGNILLPDSKSYKNNIKDKKKLKELDERVIFIDFEYCSYNYRGFDFANHFCEWAFDYSNHDYPYFYAKLDNYPNETQQRHFIREYIKASEKCRDNSPINTEDHILMEADRFTLASHLLWTLWSIKNGYSSQIVFGYWRYGKERFNAYIEKKHQLLHSDDDLPAILCS